MVQGRQESMGGGEVKGGRGKVFWKKESLQPQFDSEWKKADNHSEPIAQLGRVNRFYHAGKCKFS